MASRNGKKKSGGKPANSSQSLLGSLPSTRPARMSRPRDAAGGTSVRPIATTAAPKPEPEALAATKPKARAAAGPRAVRSGSPSLARAGHDAQRPQPASGPPKGAELVTTAVQAAGELARIGLTVGGQVLKRAVGRIPKP